MACKFRSEYPGAVYHLLNRGDRREPSFRDDATVNAFWKYSVKPAPTAIGNCMPAV
jgi:hypothetical protein